MSPLLRFLLGAALLTFCFVHPLFIIFFVGYLFYINAQSDTEPTAPPTLHGNTLTTIDDKALFMLRKEAYLKSPAWHQKRQQTLQRDNYACIKCGCRRPKYDAKLHPLHQHLQRTLSRSTHSL